MIHSAVDYINGIVKALGVFSERNGITEVEIKQSDEGDQTFPAVYIGGGDSNAINFDFADNVCYHRIAGPVTRAEDEEQMTTGCGLHIVQSAPMRMVCFVDKNFYQSDNADSPSKIAHNVANAVSQSNIKTLASSLKVDYITVRVDTINTDKVDVFNGEFTGVPYTVPSNYALFAIDYTIEIGGDERCFVSYGCGDEDIDITQLIIDEYCDNMQLGNYISVASDEQTFSDFVGYNLASMSVFVQGAGLMGSESGLTSARKLITAWNSTTGVATFKTALDAGWQISVIGKQ